MNPRIHPVPAHPLDDPRLARRLGSVQTLCQVLVVGLAGLTVGVWLIVYHALEGQPLAGRLVTIGGVSAVTVAAGVLAVLAPFVALRVGRARGEAGVRQLAAEPAGEGEAEAERLLDVFAGVTFAEYAVAGGLGFCCAAVFHLTSDPLMAVWVAGMIAFMLARYPTAARARAWFDRAAEQLACERRARTL